MKLYEMGLVEQRLDEITAKQIIAAGAIAAAALGIYSRQQDKAEWAKDQEAKKSQMIKPSKSASNDSLKLEKELNKMAKSISNKYKIDAEEARAIVLLAKKHEKQTFPKAKDILTIIGIESSFNANATSALKKDPAFGLMQVRPIVWGITADSLKGNVEKQIEFGAGILHKYHDKLGNAEDAVKAYNVGLTNFKKGKQEDAQERYIEKFKNELRQMYKDI